MLKKRHEKKDEEDGQSLKQSNACNAVVENNINAWISCEQTTEKLKDISVEKRTAVVIAHIEMLPCFTSPWLSMKSDDLFMSLKVNLIFNKIVPDYSHCHP